MDPFAYKRDAKLQARLNAEVEALARLPENTTCADCADTRRIRFCSVTLGVFLCNRCYGLHRALGAHVTRVKCLGLDAWAPAEVDFLRSVGNARAKQCYEAASTAPARPDAHAADREVAKYISDKYEKRKWCVGGATPAAAPAPPPMGSPTPHSGPAARPVVADLLNLSGGVGESGAPLQPAGLQARPAMAVLQASPMTDLLGFGVEAAPCRPEALSMLSTPVASTACASGAGTLLPIVTPPPPQPAATSCSVNLVEGDWLGPGSAPARALTGGLPPAPAAPPADERARHASTKDAIMSLFNQNLNFNNHASAPCPWPPQQR